MTLRHLKVFVSVCETGSITKTAEMMNIAQPAISQTIKELENHYSIDLFLRINRKLILTEHGRKLLIKAKNIINEFNEFESLAYELTLNPTLKVGVSITNTTNTMERLMSYVKEKHSNVSLYTYVNNASEIIDRICTGNLDFGIIEGTISNPVIDSKELRSDKLLVVCGKDFICPSTIQLKDLSKLPLLLREKGSSSRDHLEKICDAAKIEINPIMESVSNHAIINAAVASNGIAILPRVVVQPQIDEQLLKEIEIPNTRFEKTTYIVWHKGRHFNKQLQDIFNFCLSE